MGLSDFFKDEHSEVVRLFTVTYAWIEGIDDALGY